MELEPVTPTTTPESLRSVPNCIIRGSIASLSLVVMFYTYLYFDENRVPYYIGKGIGKRAWKYHAGVEVPPADRVLILKKNLTEEQAFLHEEYMIFILGRKDLGTGPLLNRTSGKQGGAGKVVSQETKEKISSAHKGKVLTEVHREKLSEAKKGERHPYFGKKGNRHGVKHTEEAKAKMSSGCKGKHKGKKWWVNHQGEVLRAVESPGPQWQNGRVYRDQS